MVYELHDLDAMTLKALFNTLVRQGRTEEVEKKFDVSVPDWLSIKFKCVNCQESQRMRIQTISIRGINRYLRCPFCRKNSYASTLHVEKKDSGLKDLKSGAPMMRDSGDTGFLHYDMT